MWIYVTGLEEGETFLCEGDRIPDIFLDCSILGAQSEAESVLGYINYIV